jgi:hypothetical protein
VIKAGTGNHPRRKTNIIMHPEVVMSTVIDVKGMDARNVVFQFQSMEQFRN